jgi:ribonucleoside-diphosphate reductase alpha chain
VTAPVSFIRIWDSMSATMQSLGVRRGVMMATLRFDHPDIEEFITANPCGEIPLPVYGA